MAPKLRTPSKVRSRLMLEVLSEMVAGESLGGLFPQVQIQCREQGKPPWQTIAAAGDTPEAVREVASGQTLFSIVNPSSVLAQAHLGTGPFPEPLPVRTIAVIPSDDTCVLAVAERTGLRTLDDLRERRYPLRLGLRGQRDHSAHAVLDDILGAAGMRLDDIVAWGGQVRYERGLPNHARLQLFERGELDAIFDEAVGAWVRQGLSLGLRPLTLSQAQLDALARRGLPHRIMRAADFPGLEADLPAIDFSGWPIFTLASVPDELVTAFCAALDVRRDQISWSEDGPLPLESMVRETPAGPLGAPLHPAAERYWREHGILR